jgi:hypothetical protein
MHGADEFVRALRQNRQVRAVLDQSPFTLVIFALDGAIEQVEGRPLPSTQTLPHLHRPADWARIQPLIKGRTHRVERRVSLTLDGVESTWIKVYTPFHSSGGRIVGILLTVVQVSGLLLEQ